MTGYFRPALAGDKVRLVDPLGRTWAEVDRWIVQVAALRGDLAAWGL